MATVLSCSVDRRLKWHNKCAVLRLVPGTQYMVTINNKVLFNKHTNVKDRLEAKYYQTEQPQPRVLISGLTKTERENSLC